MFRRFTWLPILCFLVILNVSSLLAQQSRLKRIEPLNWWVGMKDPHVQLMVQGNAIGSASVSIGHPGVHLQKVHRPSNPDFLFLDLLIDDDTQPGKVSLHFSPKNGPPFTHSYMLKSRHDDYKPARINASDAIYLITPDRFANGDPSNDTVAGLRDSLNRSNANGRHGGDIRGIIDHLNYLQNLGVTTLWINPLLTNAMPDYSYHGYAITDFYHIDPRFGSNSLYKEMAEKLHQRGMKLIMDMVFNHAGKDHWWVSNPPDSNWIHPYQKSNFAMSSVSDPHALPGEKASFQNGWFVPSMPDLNEKNPYLANYLIQNSIWWIEYAGLDGIRMDTYPFNNQPFMKRWVQRVETEYPGFYIVGESWYSNVAEESYWAGKDTTTSHHFNTELPSITDFPLTFATHSAFGKGGSVEDIYNVLKKDFLYDRPADNLIFLDNHDMDRIFYTLNENIAKYKLAITFLLTTRGIPEMYYGTELLMATHGDDGIIRKDMPGGWQGDKQNVFTKAGRAPKQNEAFDYTRKLLQWRKGSPAIASGLLKHLPPHNNLYVYARKSPRQTVLVILNNSGNAQNFDLSKTKPLTGSFKSATRVLSGTEIQANKKLHLAANEAAILQIDK